MRQTSQPLIILKFIFFLPNLNSNLVSFVLLARNCIMQCEGVEGDNDRVAD